MTTSPRLENTGTDALAVISVELKEQQAGSATG
jgi:hypothetical protein